MKELIVYILECSDKSYYVGITNNIEKRVHEHNIGLNVSANTYSKRPVTLIWSNKFTSELESIKWEKKIKGWNRKKKEALVNGDYELLSKLSECKNETNYKNYKK